MGCSRSGTILLIWTSGKSVGHETNDRAKVHGDGTGPGSRRSRSCARIEEIEGSRSPAAARSIRFHNSYVVNIQALRMDHSSTEATQTQIYFITHGSGAFLEVRLQTVVRGERASRSIVNRTTAARSLGVVESLILTGPGSEPVFM